VLSYCLFSVSLSLSFVAAPSSIVLNCFISADLSFVLLFWFISSQINSHRLVKPTWVCCCWSCCPLDFLVATDTTIYAHLVDLVLVPVPVVLVAGESNFGYILLSHAILSAHLCLHHGCCTLREPMTRVLTTCAFIRFCAHTSFASTLSWDQSTPWPQTEPHPPTAGLDLQTRIRLSQILLLALTQVRGIEGGIQSQIIHPRWTRTPLNKSDLCKSSLRWVGIEPWCKVQTAAPCCPPDNLVSKLYQQRVSLKCTCEPASRVQDPGSEMGILTIVTKVSRGTRTWGSFHRG